ncbi:MAG: PAS domain S-box protein [Myxococcota bacterium]
MKQLSSLQAQDVAAAIVVVGSDGVVRFANASATELLGRERGELVGARYAELLGVPAGAPCQPREGRCPAFAGGPCACLVEGRRADGSAFAVECTMCSGADGVAAAVLRDVTQRQRGEDPVGLLARALDAVADPLVITDARGTILFVNQAFSAQNGYTRAEVLGQTPRVLKGTTDPAVHRDLWRTIREGGVWRGVVENRRQDGTRYDAELTVVPLRAPRSAAAPPAPDEGPSHFIATHRDITQRLRVEEALRRSEASFRALIEQAPFAVAVMRGGVLHYVNRAYCALVGAAHPGEVLGRPLMDVVARDGAPAAAPLGEVLDTQRACHLEDQQFLRRDGSVGFLDITAIPVTFDGLPSVVGLLLETTARKQLAAQLMQVDRMVSVGTLAAGVGHEVNNPLTYVDANLDYASRSAQEVADLLLAQVGNVSPAAATALDTARERLRELGEALGDARDGAGRVRNIVRDLKTFSRADEDTAGRVRVERVLESAINMAGNVIRQRARLVKEVGATPPVVANESRLGQVFLNVLVNAAQAIPEGREPREIHVRTFTEGDRVVVSIADTGVGIPPENLRRIFDPFFTTKPVGQGTGLGLSVCHNIIRALGGEIRVRSQVGVGSEFRLILPAAPP